MSYTKIQYFTNFKFRLKQALSSFNNYKQMLPQINMAMYQQMGFTKQQVKKAYEYSQAKKIDIFDALQYLQKRQSVDNAKQRPQNASYSSPQRRLQSSILVPFKNINLNNYQLLFSKKSSRMSLTTKKFDLRQQASPVGLLNVYNCCYLNSLLQCYFLSSDLMRYIFEAQPITFTQDLQQKMGKIKVKRIQNQFNLVYTLKDIFGRMCLTSKKYIDPTQVLKNLVDSVGQKIQFGQEKDLFQTNIMIIERLNQCLLYTKKYYRPQNQDKQKQNNNNETRPQSFISDESEIVMNKSNTISPTKSIVNKTKIRQQDNIKRLFYGQKIQYTEPINKTDPVQQTISDFLGIIVNPANQNLYKALYQEFHYEVQIEHHLHKKQFVKTKKHTYIRQAPQYMYFYINRTGYNAQQKHALKNQQKLSFDFVIYLDRFLEKYKQQAQKNTPLVIQLWKRKNQLRKKLNNFDIFARKLEQCRQLAIDQWKNKLPNQKQIQNQKLKMMKDLEDIQKQLQKVQSRKQKYYLMYIFSHRGDAVSGHYWGYGRNDQSWYKFDINTKKMKQQEILLDLYKSGGTPYALVYVKQKHLPKFRYQYHTKFTKQVEEVVDLIQFTPKKQIINHKKYEEQQKIDNAYVKIIPQGIKKVIISQNIQIHQEHTKRRNFQVTIKTIKEYLTRYNYISSQFQQLKKKTQNNFKILPSYDNFAIYLWSLNEVELAKYNIFAVSLRIASNMTMTAKDLIEKNQTLLNLIQKQFKKKAKKDKTLKHFCIAYQPKQGQKYSIFHKNYIMQKQSFLTLLRLMKTVQQVQKLRQEKIPITQEIQKKINELLKKTATLKNVSQKNNSYIKYILTQLSCVFLLKFIIMKGSIKLSEAQLNVLISPNLKKQLQILDKTLNGSLSLKNVAPGGTLITQKQYFQSNSKRNLTGQQPWNTQQLGKGPNRNLLQKRFPEIIHLLSTQVKIYKRVQKQEIFSTLNLQQNELREYKPSAQIVQVKKIQEQSLI